MNRPLEVAREVIDVARRESITFLAAAVAYYAFVSIVPLLLLAIVGATVLGGPAFADRVVEVLTGFLSPSARTALRTALVAGPESAGATIASLVALLWSSLKVFRGLDRAFSLVYGTTDVGGVLDEFRDAVVAVSTIAVAVVLATIVGGTLQGIGGAVGVVAGVFLVPVTLFLAFLPLYYLFPNVDLPLREAVPGAATAAVGWWVLAGAFGLYASLVGSASLYGVLGAALLLSTWLYFGATIVILGAVVNATLAGRTTPDDELSGDPDPGDGGAASEDRQVQHPGPRQE